ncbi:biliverdin-producing heme oxygenase [Rhizobium sp. Root1220]|uniref:biliverdin-producing heme oxygenase n=1 Tax=Rhizobium sp. Root1220 TaxID=1736432 RepID=UPI0006F647D0|nr:biliverdin-producing heme oxygenase [Rhizobium sp. Root1220]KQV83719.1 heme oxygenase [Rhizobium sp. Root1220]
MPLRSALRAETSNSHAAVDAIFGRFDLADPLRYRSFLSAHARIVPGVEAALERAGIDALVPDWPDRRRRALLMADLADLDVEMPPQLPAPALSEEAHLWGAAYVLEGSKLGGAMLARQVPSTLPSRYLTPNGARGSARSFMDRLDNAALPDPTAAVDAARAVFALFREAAAIELELQIS